MASDLTRMELSGAMRVVKRLSMLDPVEGINTKERHIVPKSYRNGLAAFVRGGYNDKFGSDMFYGIVGHEGISIESIDRDIKAGTATFAVAIEAPTFHEVYNIKIPHGEY